MKTTILAACFAAVFLAESAFGTVTFTATPSTQSAVAGGTFTVTFGLQVTGTTNPSDLDAFDLYIATVAANSGLFTITAATGIAPWTDLGPSFTTDPISTPAASGFVRNNVDMSFFATSTQSVPYTGNIETLTFKVSNAAATGTYSFSTTTSTNAGANYSDVGDSMGGVFPGLPATFQIMIVPEPSACVLVFLGAGVLAISLSCRRRSA